jgi:hypothetical protein
MRREQADVGDEDRGLGGGDRALEMALSRCLVTAATTQCQRAQAAAVTAFHSAKAFKR